MSAGTEWLVDAQGCSADVLRDIDAVRSVCDEVVADLALRVVGEPMWNQFPPPGGVTGLYLLTESHLACHTFPETGLATFNLYCCRPRPAFAWDARLRVILGASRVTVRTVVRGAGTTAAQASSDIAENDSLETPDPTSFEAKPPQPTSAREVARR